MAEIITVRKLSKQYNPPDGPMAINEVDLQIQEGEIFSLLGPQTVAGEDLLSSPCSVGFSRLPVGMP